MELEKIKQIKKVLRNPWGLTEALKRIGVKDYKIENGILKVKDGVMELWFAPSLGDLEIALKILREFEWTLILSSEGVWKDPMEYIFPENGRIIIIREQVKNEDLLTTFLSCLSDSRIVDDYKVLSDRIIVFPRFSFSFLF